MSADGQVSIKNGSRWFCSFSLFQVAFETQTLAVFQGSESVHYNVRDNFFLFLKICHRYVWPRENAPFSENLLCVSYDCFLCESDDCYANRTYVRLLCVFYDCCANRTIVEHILRLLCESYDCCTNCTIVVRIIRLLSIFYDCCANRTIVVRIIRLLCLFYDFCTNRTIVVAFAPSARSSLDNEPEALVAVHGIVGVVKLLKKCVVSNVTNCRTAPEKSVAPYITNCRTAPENSVAKCRCL
jgi:hypothetical protein